MKLTDSQYKKLIWSTNIDLLGNQPLISGPKRTLAALEGEKQTEKMVAGHVARNIITAQIRDFARRQDSFQKEGTPFGARYVKTKDWKDKFKENIPWVRPTMPSGSKPFTPSKPDRNTHPRQHREP